MTKQERSQSNAAASQTGRAQGAPSPWISRFLSASSRGGTLLDLACGRGRHTWLAHALDFEVTAVDRNLDGVADLAGTSGIELVQADLECDAPWPLAGRTFDVVVVTNYLWRPIFSDIVASVARDGLLLYETFAVGNERFGSPRNSDFLLAPGELLDRTRDALVPIAYEHVTLEEPPRLVARIAAVGRDHVWLNDPPRADF